MKAQAQPKVGIIGYGNMGSAIAERIKTYYDVQVFEKDKVKVSGLKGMKAAASLAELTAACETLILAIKPQDLDHVLRELRNQVKDKLVISIAAGIPTKYIEKQLGDVRLVRAMPNIGARAGVSVTCLCQGQFATDEDMDLAHDLFALLGVNKDLEENMMNAATAISGSGPAYVFDFIQTQGLDIKDIPSHTKQLMIMQFEGAAEAVGFNREDALFLAATTTDASLKIMAVTKLPPQELIKQVASKGGTTEAALEVIHKGGSWEEAAVAAAKRAEELSKR